MSRERIIAIWRVTIAAVMALLVLSGESSGSRTAVAVYAGFAALLLALPDHFWIVRPIRWSLHCADVVMLLALLGTGAPLPILLFAIHLIPSGAFLTGAWGAAATALSLVLWRVFDGTPAPVSSAATETLALLTGAVILASAVHLWSEAAIRERADLAWLLDKTSETPESILQDYASGIGASRVTIVWQGFGESSRCRASWPYGSASLEPEGWTWDEFQAPAVIVGRLLLEEKRLRVLGVRPFAANPIVLAPIHGRTSHGWILAETGRPSRQALVACERIATRVARLLELRGTTSQVRESAVAQERERIARDLHDGPLQSVIGAKLQVHASGGSGTVVAASIETIGREISSMIRHLRPLRPTAAESRLTTRLSLLAAEVKRQWNIDLELGEMPNLKSLDAPRQREVRRLIREAVLNAARHSGSPHIQVQAVMADDQLQLVVRDRGHGFPFTGRVTLMEMRAAGNGPRSLCERIEQLAGDMIVESSAAGSAVTMMIPIREEIG